MLRVTCAMLVIVAICVGGVSQAAPVVQGNYQMMQPAGPPAPPTQQVLSALAVSATRDLQLQTLQRGSSKLRAKLVPSLSTSNANLGADQAAAMAFRDGVVLTPLACAYPANQPSALARASVAGQALFGADVALPSQSQNPPFACWHSSMSQYKNILNLTLKRAPETGVYAVTVNAAPLTGTWAKAPFFRAVINYVNSQAVETVGNTEWASSTQWCTLVSLTKDQTALIMLFYDGPGAYVAWSSVTIRKL